MNYVCAPSRSRLSFTPSMSSLVLHIINYSLSCLLIPFVASTFTARVVASTLSDMHSCITAAIGALRGPLHGGANEATMNLIAKFSSPDEAEKGVSGHGCVSVMISTNGQ